MPKEVSEINAIALKFQSTESEKSFNEIYDKLYYPILNFSRKYLLNFFKYNPNVAYREAPDVCNKTFVRVYQKIEQFNPEYQFTTWIYTIAKNLCLHTINKHKKEKLQPFDFNIPVLTEEANTGAFNFAEDVELWSTENYELEEYEENRIFQHILQEGLDKMDEVYRNILIEHEFNDMKYREIADKYDMNINTVKTRIRRSRQDLEENCQRIRKKYEDKGILNKNTVYA